MAEQINENPEKKVTTNLDGQSKLDANLDTMKKLFQIEGMLETVTTVPTKTPTKLEQQIKIYMDSTSSPAIRRLYIYSNKQNAWIPWEDLSVIVTAKGDLISTADGTVLDNLAIGSNNEVLMADSGETLGMKWTPLVSAKGNLISTADGSALGNLAIGANDTILTADSGESLGMKWLAPYFLGVEASDILRQSADTERSEAGNVYVLKKQIRIRMAGTIRVKFDLRNASDTANLVAGRIYKNGVAFGTEQTSGSSVYATFSEDIVVEINDLIQLYLKGNTGGVGYTAFGKNFRFYYDLTASAETEVDTN